METLGLSGWPRYLDRIPLAEARLLAIDDDISRVAIRRCWARPGNCAPLWTPSFRLTGC